MDECSYDSRKSDPKDRVEVTIRGERRRRWSSEEKLQIVRETLRPGAVTAAVAERHEIGTGQLYTWRKQMLTAAKTQRHQPRGHRTCFKHGKGKELKIDAESPVRRSRLKPLIPGSSRNIFPPLSPRLEG